MPRPHRRTLGWLGALLFASSAHALPPQPQELIYSTEGNRLRRYDVDTIDAPPLAEDILVERASLDPVNGRDVNGMICAFPDGSGRFVLGEDTGQPTPPAGFGVFEHDGTQVGKLTPTFNNTVDSPEPFGCGFGADDLLFTSDVGDQGLAGTTGQLIVWFPPYDGFPNGNDPSDNFCKLAVDIGTAGAIAIDGEDRVYVSASGGLQVLRFSPPFPTGPDGAGGCGLTDPQGSPFADVVDREVFLPQQGVSTYSGLAIGPSGNLFVGRVLTGEIEEYDLSGNLVRVILDPPEALPPISTGNPQTLAFDADGSLYYADLDLVGTFPNVSPGPNGKVRRIRFDANGDPLAPEIVRQNLSFPDGVALLAGDLEPRGEWRSYAGGPSRLFFNPDETQVTAANADQLQELWRFPTGAIITGSPSVAVVDVPGEGRIQVVYFQSWDLNVYALRLVDGSELWRFATVDQPGASFPSVASVDVSEIDGEPRVFIGAGEVMYALDAASGAEIWRFYAGTGCVDAMGMPPGLCGFSGERNEIESSVLVADGKVFFGMDVNDVATGKGGFYALDASDGTLAWYFDPESATTCTPLAGDAISHFDGYHSEAELGLPAGFFASRPGCGFPRTPNGCGNIWSSPAGDPLRQTLYVASSNCDTDNDPGTHVPPPPMPPGDEAILAIGYDGTLAWRWRPREVDNGDLAFGAAPNLFSIDFGGAPREVLGIGNKDGSYYVLDRDGVNEVSGVAWNDPDPSALPYWTANVVPGGEIGGIILTSAVDEAVGRIYISTGPGTGANAPPLPPQRPTLHALDADSGAVVWDNSADTSSLSSFAPTSAIPGVVFFGQVPGAEVRVHATADGAELLRLNLANFASASAPAVVDGVVLVGEGIGTRTASGNSSSDLTAAEPSDLTAFCVPGTEGCFICGDGILNPGEECDDGNEADGDGCSAVCTLEPFVVFSGTAQGGFVRVVIEGVTLEVTTLAGQSAETVAGNVAAAINGDPTLTGLGVTATAVGGAVTSNGDVTEVRIEDPGLAPPIPSLPAGALALLVVALAAAGALTLARGRRSVR